MFHRRGRIVAALLVAIGGVIPLAASSCNDAKQSDGGTGDAPLPDGGLGLVNGLPIVMRRPNGAWTDIIVYDQSLHDPLTDWGSCVDRVRACYRSTPTAQPIKDCIANITACSDKPGEEKKGGDGCCPKQCLADFADQIDTKKADTSEDDVVSGTFGVGTCVAGLEDFEKNAGVNL